MSRAEIPAPSALAAWLAPSWLTATAHVRVVERWYAIGGASVRLCFAGEALLPAICPALDHLPAPAPRDPALTVYLWDSASTGAPAPPPLADAPLTGGVLRAHQLDPPCLSVYCPAEAVAAYWVPTVDSLTWPQRAAPLLAILLWWQQARGWQLLHGAAVGTAAGCAVLAGTSGAGKSTTALACLAHGLEYLGDDYVLLAADGAPDVHNVYNSAKLRVEQLAALPALAALAEGGIAGRTPEGKAVWFVHEALPARLPTARPLKAVLAPTVVDRVETRAVPISGAAGLLALAPSTLAQLPARGDVALATMARALRAVPCYRLELGRDLAGVAAAVEAVLAGR